MDQIKPEVIGYRMVFSDGDVSHFVMNRLGMDRMSRKDDVEDIAIHPNGKQKFRPVYKTD